MLGVVVPVLAGLEPERFDVAGGLPRARTADYARCATSGFRSCGATPMSKAETHRSPPIGYSLATRVTAAFAMVAPQRRSGLAKNTVT